MGQGANLGDIRAYITDVQRGLRNPLGIIGSESRLAARQQQRLQRKLQESVAGNVAGDIKKTAEGVVDMATSMYQGADDFWKGIALELQESRYRKLLGESAEDLAAFEDIFGSSDVTAVVAEWTKRTMQHYDSAFRVGRQLSRFPLTSPLVTFTFEMPRNQVNVLRRAAKEYQMFVRTGNESWRRAAVDSVGGVVGSLMIPAVVAGGANAALGHSQEQVEAYRNVMAREWDQNALGLVITEFDPYGESKYIDWGYASPYATNAELLEGARQLLVGEGDFVDRVLNYAEQIEDTFFGTEIAVQAAVEQWVNARVDTGLLDSLSGGFGKGGGSVGFEVSNPESPVTEQFKDRLFHLHRSVGPQTAVSGERLLRSLGALDNSQFQYETFYELMALGGGPRVSNVDNASVVRRNYRVVKERRSDLLRAVEKGKASPEQAQAKWQDIWDQALWYTENHLKAGIPDDVVEESLKSAGFNEKQRDWLLAGVDNIHFFDSLSTSERTRLYGE
jgi:hypothetical protein